MQTTDRNEEGFRPDPQIERWLSDPAQASARVPPDFLRRARDYLRRKREHEAAQLAARRGRGGRSTMTAREKAAYITEHGRAAYLALPW